MKLPKPAHKHGYTIEQLQEICQERGIDMDRLVVSEFETGKKPF